MNLVRQWLRDAVWIIVGYFVILEAALVAAILYWPRFRDNTPAIAKLVPFESLQNLMESIEISGYWPYLAVQQWFKGCSLFGLAAAAFLASGVVARDVDQKTIEFLLSRPVSRSRILLTRWVMVSLAVIMPAVLSSISAVWLSPLVDEQVAWTPLLVSTAFMSLFLLMLVTFTVMLSAMSSHQMRAGIILIAIILLNFALYLVQGIDELSLFKTIDVKVFMLIEAGHFPWVTAGAFLVATIAMLITAMRVFGRRDF